MTRVSQCPISLRAEHPIYVRIGTKYTCIWVMRIFVQCCVQFLLLTVANLTEK
jgi:hypothetical protein